MDGQNARAWLDALAVAWRSRDAQKMADLFTADATEQDKYSIGKENYSSG